MKTLVFFLEEPSAEEMLKGILPKILPKSIPVKYCIFEGKQDLEKRMPLRLRAWKDPNCAFLVMRDQDSGDCKKIKHNLLDLCSNAGDVSPVIRIACRELESFYLGDLAAVERGLGITGFMKRQKKAIYRDPDRIGTPAEELKKLTKGLYQKVAGSRCIAPHLDLHNNKSHSFNVLVKGIQKLVKDKLVESP